VEAGQVSREIGAGEEHPCRWFSLLEPGVFQMESTSMIRTEMACLGPGGVTHTHARMHACTHAEVRDAEGIEGLWPLPLPGSGH
jgi:hypothetical protein